MGILIKNGRIIDPANDIDGVMDLLIEGGRIDRVEKNIKAKNSETIDAKGKIVMPGLIDMHAHLREPGREDEETLMSGAQAAAKGGFTTVCCMANTNPVIDNQGVVEFINSRAHRIALVNIFPIGAVTKGLAGKELAEIGELKESGVVALSDDGRPVSDSSLMRRALEYAKMFNVLIISHCEDVGLFGDGVMNEGFVSTLLGLQGIPATAEAVMVARDIELLQLTGGKLHIAHVSAAESAALIKEAKKQGLKVTCETCPHYFTLTDEAVKTFDTSTKVNPPLREKGDVEAIKSALSGGTIDVIATDHAPHTEAEKDVEFDRAPFGMIGLETALSLAIMQLVDGNILTLPQLVEKFSVNPATILGLKKGRFTPGWDADVVVMDLEKEWTVDKTQLRSKSKNSPFIGWTLKGVVEYTICKGKVVYPVRECHRL